MSQTTPLSRRRLIASAATCLGAAPSAASAATQTSGKLKPSIFSKHLHYLEGEELASKVAELGFDSVDLTVRKGGHVEPARAAEELPRLEKLFRKHGVEVAMITVDIVDAETPYAEPIVKTMADLGIRYYRWGGLRYVAGQPVIAQLEKMKPRVRKLAALNARYKVSAMYHCHSGPGQVGAPLWDLYLLLQDQDPAAVGFNYDIGHAVVEGGYGGWIDSLLMTGPWLRGVAIKDFVWEKSAKGDWRPAWKPTGEGMVRFPEFFKMLAQLHFSGPLQLHCEYPLGGADTGSRQLTIGRDEVYAAIRRDNERLRGWLRDAGLS